MAEKQTSFGSFKTVPAMKLFAVGELDRTPPNCIPRLCNLTVTKLQVLQPLGTDLASVNLAVKMQSSKRILRSNEIPLCPNGTLDTELQLTFSLQYPHFLKRDGNVLQIMLQKRKKYKNRALLGCKTLAVGYINMTQILQRPVDRTLDLCNEGKEKTIITFARVHLVSLSSQPVDTEEASERPKDFLADTIIEREDSEEDEDYSSPEDGSDSETLLEGGPIHQTHRRLRRLRVNQRAQNLPPNVRQRNFKQRFVSLLKKFKVPEVLQAYENEPGLGPQPEVDDEEIEDLFNELENLSDSGPEVDTISISSTPKPTLRPYFSSSKTLLNDGLASAEKIAVDHFTDDESSKKADSDPMEVWTDQEQSDTQGLASSSPREDRSRSNISKFFREANSASAEKKRNISGSSTPRQDKFNVDRKNSALSNLLNMQPRKILLEHLAKVFPAEDCELPSYVILVNNSETHGSTLSSCLVDRGHRVISTMTPADVKATLGLLVNKLQKFCNSNAKDPGPVKIVVIGSDTYINCVLRPYVEQISSKPRDFQNIFKFLCIPLAGVNSISKYLGSIDSIYGATFVSESWKELMDKWENQEVQEAANRVHQYLAQSEYTLNLPIAEAVITCRGKSDEESCQTFVPFITDVRLGSGDVTSCSIDLDEASANPTPPPAPQTVAGSPPGSSPQSAPINLNVDKNRSETTPPSSPNIAASHFSSRMAMEAVTDKEPLELQIDYWLLRAPNREERDRDRERVKADGGKYTMKGTFRTLQVSRLAPLGAAPPVDPISSLPHLTFSYATKEKKQRIIRIGKKREREKETESRREVIDGICRLLASTKNQPMTVSVDSVEWTNVKFFQISSQWQTQIKTFPVSLFSLQ